MLVESTPFKCHLAHVTQAVLQCQGLPVFDVVQVVLGTSYAANHRGGHARLRANKAGSITTHKRVVEAGGSSSELPQVVINDTTSKRHSYFHGWFMPHSGVARRAQNTGCCRFSDDKRNGASSRWWPRTF